LVDLDSWYDVDDAASLRRLIAELDSNGSETPRSAGFPAPATAGWLRRNDIRQQFAIREPTHASVVEAVYVRRKA
jgi:hypothetical protein